MAGGSRLFFLLWLWYEIGGCGGKVGEIVAKKGTAKMAGRKIWRNSREENCRCRLNGKSKPPSTTPEANLDGQTIFLFSRDSCLI
jgi:hypothetical protein